MSISLRSRVLTALVVLVAGFIGAVAQRPGPANFMAKVVAEPNTVPYVLLSWKNPEGEPAPTKYKVYRYAGQSEKESDFDAIGVVEVDPNKPPREGVYTFMVKDLRPGPYTFFVRGYWGDNEGARSSFKFVVVPDKPVEGKVVFVTSPKKTGEEGKVYEYDADAEASGGTITYSLVNGPDGMTIDPATGVVRWENPKNGRYEIVIKAVVVIDGKEYMTKQSYVLEIGKGEDRPKFCASIFGTITFSEQSSTTPKGYVTAWRLDRIKKENGDTVEAYRPVYKAEIKQGSYVLELPNGTYKIRVEGENFLAEWHEDVTELADAETVTIECNTRSQINFTVDARPEPTLVVVSGRMFDAETNEPMKGLVIFEARGKEDDGVDSRYRRVVAEINEDGTYEIRLQAGVDYIAFAKAGRGKEDGDYLAEFWNNTNDGTQASVLNVTENTEDIDFPMDKRPVYQNGFGGMMKNVHTSAGIGGKVVAYRLATRVKDNGDTLVNKEKAVTVETDDNFGYSFSNLIPGTYIVFGMPKDRPNVPGWMVLGDTASPEWREATRIEVGEAMLTVQYDILIDTAKGQRGKGRVRGFVYDKRGGIIAKGDDDRVQNASAILGSLIVARDENGDIIDFAMSANEGAFQLTELAVGNVTITADRVEYESATQTLTIDANNVDQQVTLGLVPVVSSVEVPVDLVGTSLNLFPNPASTTATVRFDAVAGTADVRVLSMTGIVLATQAVTVNGGTTSITLNTASLPQGMVMVQITNGTTSFALPLQIVR